jgi:hypothetical protein
MPFMTIMDQNMGLDTAYSLPPEEMTLNRAEITFKASVTAPITIIQKNHEQYWRLEKGANHPPIKLGSLSCTAEEFMLN